MKTMIVYYDYSKKNFRKITPFAQGPEWDSKTRFDGQFGQLREHLDGDNYSKMEIIGE